MTLCAWCYAEKALGEPCPNRCGGSHLDVVVDAPAGSQPPAVRVGHVKLYCVLCGRLTETRNHLGRCPSCAGR